MQNAVSIADTTVTVTNAMKSFALGSVVRSIWSVSIAGKGVNVMSIDKEMLEEYVQASELVHDKSVAEKCLVYKAQATTGEVPVGNYGRVVYIYSLNMNATVWSELTRSHKECLNCMILLING